MFFVILRCLFALFFFFFQAEDGIRDGTVTGVQTCALPISPLARAARACGASLAAKGTSKWRPSDMAAIVPDATMPAKPDLCPMRIPYELALGWRYTRAGRAARRNGFISFISGVSMLGIALGVAALIIVLSVMNGFQKEVRDRMLGVISHIEVFAPGGVALPDPAKTLAEIKANPQVTGAATFIAAQALLARGEDMKGTIVRGIDPALEGQVTDLAVTSGPTLAKLVPGNFGVVLGGELARAMGVREGDTVTLIAPSGQVTPAGVVPRLKQMTVVGTFDSGHFEYDSALVMLHQDDAARIFRLEGPTGIRIKL